MNLVGQLISEYMLSEGTRVLDNIIMLILSNPGHITIDLVAVGCSSMNFYFQSVHIFRLHGRYLIGQCEHIRIFWGIPTITSHNIGFILTLCEIFSKS